MPPTGNHKSVCQSRGRPASKPSPDGLIRHGFILFIAVSAVFLLFAPQYLNLFWIRILTNVFMFAILAQALNIIAGYTGYPAFGNVVFFGLGAYGTAITMVKYHGDFLHGMIVGVVVSLFFALMMGPPLLRLRGHYFAIATLGFNEATKAITNNLTGFTGGGLGLSLPLPPGEPAENAAYFYYVLYGGMVLSIVVTYVFSISRIGIGCRAIRENELKAEAVGLHTTRYKIVAWMISAALTSIAGSTYAYWLSYIEPSVVFDMNIAIKSFVIFLLGGAGTVFGPIFGAFFIEIMSTLAWSSFLEYHLGAMGLVIIIVVVFLPKGFVVFVRDNVSFASLFRHIREQVAKIR